MEALTEEILDIPVNLQERVIKDSSVKLFIIKIGSVNL